MATKMIGACLLAMAIAGLCIYGTKNSFLSQTKSVATNSVAAIQSKWATKKTSATNKASAKKNALANKTFAAIQKKSASEKASASKKISTRKNGLESKDALSTVQKTFSAVKASSVKPISRTKGNASNEPIARQQSGTSSATKYGPASKQSRPSYQEDDSLVVRANPSTSSTRGQQLLSSIQTSSMPEAEKAKSQQTLRRFSTAVENGLISAEQANQRFNLLDKNGTMNKVGEKRVRAWLKLIRRDVAKLGRTRPVPESTTTKNVSQPSSKSKEELRQILLNGNLLDLQ